MGRVYKKEWIPVCVSSRVELIYYLPTLNESLVGFGLVDSLRFGERMPNKKDVSKCTYEELDEMLEWFCEPARFFNSVTHVENFNECDRPVFEIKCPDCSFVEIFQELNNIPHNNHRCPCCGRYVIEYYGDDIYDDIDIVEYVQERMLKVFNNIIERYGGEVV